MKFKIKLINFGVTSSAKLLTWQNNLAIDSTNKEGKETDEPKKQKENWYSLEGKYPGIFEFIPQSMYNTQPRLKMSVKPLHILT